MISRSWLLATLLSGPRLTTMVDAGYYNDDAADDYQNNYNNNNNNNNYNNNNYNNNQYNNDDGNDDANNGDDYNANNGDDYNQNDANNGDDANGDDNNGDDYYANANANANNGDDYNAGDDAAAATRYQDDWAQNNADVDDDLFHWEDNVGFDGVSVMPVSCVNYNNGHMIKFNFFETDNSYQCHFAEIGTFVVSIAHYMRAYFNHQALIEGQDFQLPGDAGYLNCLKLQESASSDYPLYAKIGCMERETFTSTKLALHVYTDSQCSQPYDDGEQSRRHSTKGYEINGYTFSTRVSFRPPFYTCETCLPEEISDTFNKKYGTWYDDDYISEHGSKQTDDEDEDEDQDDANNGDDAYYDDTADDAYLSANDDIYNYNNAEYYGGDDYYNRNRLLENEGSISKALMIRTPPPPRLLTAGEGQLEAFEKEFWQDVEEQRKLYDNGYDYGDWNMCDRVYKYGVWCDDSCRSLDAFRTDRWSGADIILLSIMCTFLSAMMLLIVAKRLKAAQKSRVYQESSSMPGLPPVAMLAIFLGVMFIIIIMANLKFVNETLVFAVVTCVLLFIYMLKLTLFDNRRPVLLAAPRHELFDNPMDRRLFD